MLNKKKSRYLTLCVIAVAFLLFRLLVLFSDIKISDMYEERPMGFLAYNLINKEIELPFFFYLYTSNHGGHLISAILAVPFFYTFGTSLISLKLLPLCFFSLGTLMLWFLFLDTYFNRKAAVCFSCLYILSPPYFTLNNMISWALHIEINLFIIGTIFLFYKILLRNNSMEEKTLTRLYVKITFLGILLGFGMFYGYTSLITLISCFIIWHVSDKNSFPKFGYVAFSAGIIVGLFPMILYLLSAKHVNLYLYNKPYIPANTLLFLIKKFIRLIILGIPESFQFMGILLRKDISIFSAVYHIITLLSFLVLVYKNKAFIKKFLLALLPFKKFKIEPSSVSKEIILIIFTIVFLLILTVSEFGAPNFVRGTNQVYKSLNYYRYLLPLFPFLFAVISVAFDKIIFKDRKKIQTFIGVSVIVFLCLIGLYSNLAFISLNKNFASGLVHKGYWVEPYIRRFIFPNKDFDKIAAKLNNFKEEYKPLGAEDFGIKTVLDVNHNNIFQVNKVAEKIEKDCRKYFYYGAFREIASFYISKNRASLEKIFSFINKVPQEYKPFCYEALGCMARIKSKPRNTELSDIFLKNIDDDFKTYFYFGFGYSLVSLNPFYYQINGVKKEYIKDIPLEHRKYCYEGIGKGIGDSLNGVRLNLFQLEEINPKLRKYYFKELDNYADKSFYWMSGLEKEFRGSAYKGFGEAIGEVFKSSTIGDYLSNRIPGEYEAFYFEGLKKGNILIQNKEKRILVIAPHPDDEALGCAKVISDAVEKGYPAKLLLMTNGDRLFFIDKKKMYDFDHNGYIDYVDYGYIRQQETIKAMGKLGLERNNIIFLGYPDGNLWRLYNCEYDRVYYDIKKPFKMSPVITCGNTSFSPYRNAYHSLAYSDERTLYSRDYVINDLKEIFEAFRPTDIFVTSEFDTHHDHQAVPLFVRNALKDLKNLNKEFAFRIKTHRYLIHLAGKNNYPDPDNLRLGVRDDKNCNRIKWEDTITKYPPNGFIPLSSEFKKLKYEVIGCYLTQNPNTVSKVQHPCIKETKYSWMQLFVKDREEWWDLPTDFNVPLSQLDLLGKRDRIIFSIKNFLRALKLQGKRFLFNERINPQIVTS
ncbi:MAG: hypothetical protein A3C43_06505 [Candidatus Schekmanbacteria bacterium RIFCSPHIGHO2_02_FULL_38_11]|uniref:Glycosyltransferase RgtA/B/C/D-like domain-containing protein n=1 Tax=Candidatus Schekmanbacteria bacterium RIFCSPLOWO2_12_FULL_38_15 TaxID=1817883 RepID=A0A1F7SNV0_9BACT|nr:MAG: hypothetical protein A2043_02230 [Candidatus Schekmanbacteria bacterium GWA2_38_9]OGL49532.1 MAG: hypothetical protein A3C43_06505 [Candidatus Schekmanbacteria bacterium RIFCSPHIGHO2_02_FULL_38_11]OGL50965.1 MAG: hypothetical protein A3H37_10825 [Candidatus Schekmanbacteria bacterium RIFCSPLOWO2_02_FULL_38_14]OGL54908.1 MAG: hypothetical protein A3G31_02185 [Candidatus Schekmanbacteria bacterium RIFCSPLOWO2_12_FULL_38_15]